MDHRGDRSLCNTLDNRQWSCCLFILRVVPINNCQVYGLSFATYNSIQKTRSELLLSAQITSMRDPTGPTVQIIPIHRQHPKTIVKSIPISRYLGVCDIICSDNSSQQSPISIVRRIPTNSVCDQLSQQFQLVESLEHRLPGHCPIHRRYSKPVAWILLIIRTSEISRPDNSNWWTVSGTDCPYNSNVQDKNVYHVQFRRYTYTYMFVCLHKVTLFPDVQNSSINSTIKQY